MKAKWNNKGYSLVELLITLAIFGIVMVGIAMIMRTTSASYVNGSSEVAMQTEVQIVANQIEELLVDADTGVRYGVFDGNSFWEIDSKGYSHYVLFDAADNKLMYQKRLEHEGYLANDYAWSLMADYVSAFSIEGYEKRQDGVTPSANCDNMVTIQLEMDNDGYVYEVSRDVFFRNAIEDDTVYNIEVAAGGGAGASEDYTDIVALDRYAILNLEKDYGIVSDIATEGSFGSFYEFVTVTYRTGNKDISNAISSATHSDAATQYIAVNSATIASMSSSVTKSDKIVVSGKDADGTVKKILLTTDAVEFTLNTTDATADGVVYLSTKTGDGQGGYTWLGVKGIDIASMISIHGKSYQYAMVGYIDSNSDQQYALDNANKPGTQTVSAVTHGHSNAVSINSSGVQENLALKADPETNGFIIVQDNNSLIATDAAKAAMQAGDMRVSIMVHFPGQSTTGTHSVVDLALTAPGYDMQYYKGGNIYNATPSGWGISFTN